MEWHTRMMSFLLLCLVLIGLNVVATICGVYPSWQPTGEKPASLMSIENYTDVTG